MARPRAKERTPTWASRASLAASFAAREATREAAEAKEGGAFLFFLSWSVRGPFPEARSQKLFAPR